MNYYLNQVNDKIQRLNINEKVKTACQDILSYLETKTIGNEFGFQDLYNICQIKPENLFYDAVFLLTRHKYCVFEQVYYALNTNNQYEKVNNQDLLMENMKQNHFINPITQEILTEQEFGQQVILKFRYKG